MWRLSLLLVCALDVMAQQVGRAPQADEVRQYGLTVAPDGKGLPAGKGTPAQGRELFSAKCARCHGEKAQGDVGPPLVGGQGTLATKKPLKTVGSFWPYAPTVWDYVHRAMPFDKAGTLANDEVYSLVSYLLFLNGIIGEQDTIDAKSLAKVRMPNRDGFIPDPRPDVRRK
ncbi:MAG: c-type cytochrome [Bryobacteraceae bacterium]